MNSNISGEENLLISMCRLGFNDEQAAVIREMASGVKNWDYLVSLANLHGVSALLYHNLTSLGLINQIPVREADSLKNARMISITRNVSHFNNLEKALRLLNDSGIKTVLLKGLALELMVYGNSGLRQMTDADVLISKEQCLEARDILLRNGFTALPLKSPLYKVIILYTGKHLPSLIRDGFSFEIHHELFGSEKSHLTRMLYDESIENKISEEKIYIPRPQMLFLYLVKHLFLHEKNSESQLRLYTDLVVLTEKYADEILTEDLLKYADEAGIYKTLIYKLVLLRDLWKIKLPGWLNELIDRDHGSTGQPDFYFFLRSPKNNLNINKEWLYRYNIKEIPGIHRKLLYILGDLFPSVSFMKKRYNCKKPWMIIFFYPHRLGKLWYLFKKQKGGE